MWGSIAAIGAGLAVLGAGIGIGQIGGKAVSYTHLTLPTNSRV